MTGLQSGFLLVGGPMDGWYVKPDAPALREDWWETYWPEEVPRRYRKRVMKKLKIKWPSGRYVPIGPDEFGVERAEWQTEAGK